MEGLKMIKLEDVLLSDIAPHSLLGTVDMDAYSMTLRDAIRLLLGMSEKTMVYYNFDKQSEKIIDLMALEWRTQFYDGEMELERKKELVKNTLPWYLIAGTDGAVNGLLETLFGNGRIVPWYEYGGQPYHAKVSANIEYSEDIMEKFDTMLRKVKKASTILDEIEMKNFTDARIHTGVFIQIQERVYFAVPAVSGKESVYGSI